MAKLTLMVAILLIINSFANALGPKTNPNIKVTKDSVSFSNEITFGPEDETLTIEKTNCEIKRPKSAKTGKAVTITPKSYDVLKKSFCQHAEQTESADKKNYRVCKSSLNALENVKDDCKTVDERGFYVNDQLHLFVKDRKSDLELELICEKSTNTCESYLKKNFLTLRTAEIALNRSSNVNDDNYEPFLSFLSVPKAESKDQKDPPQADVAK